MSEDLNVRVKPVNPIEIKGAIAFSAEHSRIWAEGTDEEVEQLGGEHSAKGWSDVAGEEGREYTDQQIALAKTEMAGRIATASQGAVSTANAYTDTQVGIEANARENADDSLQYNIGQEESARISADNNLQGQIDALEDVGYSIWQKPSDWPDIRSGALNNSVYFLVGHSADYSSYPKFSLTASVSTSANTYDVFVDGVKKATTANSTTTTLDWQTLALTTGFDVTHPSALRAHIVRITPTVSTDTLTATRIMNISGQAQQGALWLHFQLSNAIKITNLAGTESSVRNLLLEAITAKNDKITYTVSGSNSGLYGSFAYCESLVRLPVLEAANTTYASGDYLNFRAVPAKKIVIKNNKGTENFLGSLNNTNIQKLDVENGISMHSGVGNLTALNNATKLKHFPTFNVSTSNTQFIAYRLDSLENTVIDDSQNTARKVFRLYGTSTNPTSGLKGLTVSNVAPFDYATAPQIDVSYTGLDRAALVNLFNSLPTVSASQVCTITGATGASDLTASDIAIVTGKGWTLTR